MLYDVILTVMILDTLNNASLYHGLSPSFAKALQYLQSREWQNLPIGNHTIDGDKLVLQVQSYETDLYENLRWEAHKKHADIQVVVSGTEVMGHCGLDAIKNPTEYNTENDIYWYEASGNLITYNPDMFAIFFPTDGHMPRIATNKQPSTVKKLVMKVRLD